ncbi:MAG: hypothetical protein HYY35_01685 [Deltaproteobacteria bacterium]|nr:hypothetical protein [Deltaproteobacteria bacterium]
MSAGYFDSHPSSVERAVTARRQAEDLLAAGEPPGRAEVMARERAGDRRWRARSARAPEGAYTRSRRERPVDDVPPAPSISAAIDPENCKRAEVYAEMARDSHDPAERRELYQRALHYCPTLSEARSGAADDRWIDGGDRDTPAETY